MALLSQFHTQAEPAYCGLASLVMALNALAIDPQKVWKGPWRWYAEDLLDCCVPLPDVREQGITLPQAACLARCNGCTALAQHVPPASAEPSELGAAVQDFRRHVRAACGGAAGAAVAAAAAPLPSACSGDDHSMAELSTQPIALESVLIVSYHRGTLGQTGTGHFSPIAAYSPAHDSVLILDSARFKYDPHWVKLPLLVQAMQAEDTSTGKPRGYLLLRRSAAATLWMARLASLRAAKFGSPDGACKHCAASAASMTRSVLMALVQAAGQGDAAVPVPARIAVRYLSLVEASRECFIAGEGYTPAQQAAAQAFLAAMASMPAYAAVASVCPPEQRACCGDECETGRSAAQATAMVYATASAAHKRAADILAAYAAEAGGSSAALASVQAGLAELEHIRQSAAALHSLDSPLWLEIASLAELLQRVEVPA